MMSKDWPTAGDRDVIPARLTPTLDHLETNYANTMLLSLLARHAKTSNIPMQFQPINDRLTLAQDGFIQLGTPIRQLLRKNITCVAAKNFPVLAQSTTLDQRLIDHDVPAIMILYEKHEFWQMIEELFNHG
jgi:hypothetical protein